MEFLTKAVDIASMLFIPVMMVLLIITWVRDDIKEKKQKKLLLQNVSDLKVSIKNLTGMLKLSLQLNDNLIKVYLTDRHMFSPEQIKELNDINIAIAKVRENYVEVWEEQDKI